MTLSTYVIFLYLLTSIGINVESYNYFVNSLINYIMNWHNWQTFAQIFGAIGGGFSGFVAAWVLLKDRVRLTVLLSKKSGLPTIIVNNPNLIELTVIRIGAIGHRNINLVNSREKTNYILLEKRASCSKPLKVSPFSAKKLLIHEEVRNFNWTLYQKKNINLIAFATLATGKTYYSSNIIHRICVLGRIGISKNIAVHYPETSAEALAQIDWNSKE